MPLLARTVHMTKWVLNLRVWALALCFLWGCYFLALWRTTSFGFTWRGILADALFWLFFVFPFVIIATLGLPWRKAGLSVLAIGLGSVLVTELYAGAQELCVVLRYGENPGKETFVKRWPPFSNHYIGYSPGYGWMGGD